MFSLQKLLGKEDRVLALLEASAEEALSCVHSLTVAAMDFKRAIGTAEAAYVRHRAREITEEITVAVHTDYFTSIQREDIQALANALYRITKTADKYIDRALLAPRFLKDADFSRQAALLENACEIVLQLVGSLRHGMKPIRVKGLVEQLQAAENEADGLMPALYAELFSGRYEAVHAIFLKDLHELLEKAIDRCRNAGNIVAKIVLKNS